MAGQDIVTSRHKKPTDRHIEIAPFFANAGGTYIMAVVIMGFTR